MKKILTLLAALLIFPHIAFGAISYLESSTIGDCSGATTCASGAITIASGNAVLVGWRNSAGVGPTTLTGNSNTYTSSAITATDASDGNSIGGIGFAMNANSGSTQVTMTTASASNKRIAISEFSGVALTSAQDKTVSATGTNSPMATGTMTPDTDGEAFFCAVHTSSSVTSPTAGTDFTTGVTSDRLLLEYYVQPTIAAHTCSATATGTFTYTFVGITVRPPAAAATANLPRVSITGASVSITGGNVTIRP